MPVQVMTLYTVREFLAADLDERHRAADLEALSSRLAEQPLTGTVTDLRQALAGGIGMEEYLRLHTLISTLYHQAGAGIPLARDLYRDTAAALQRDSERRDRVLLEP